MVVKNILAKKGSTKVETISPTATIAEAAQILSDKKIGALIVSETGKTVDGIISERDIVRELAASGNACLGGVVSSIMTKEVMVCEPSERAVRVLERMTQGRFRHMPVVDGGKMVGLLSIVVNGELAGLISIGDVVKARMAEIEMENTALADMIRGA